MKICPQCRRDYNDDSLKFCLDDGAELLFGAGTAESKTEMLFDVPQSRGIADGVDTQLFGQDRAAQNPQSPTRNPQSSARTQDTFDKRLLIAPLLLAVAILVGFFGYRYLTPSTTKQIESIAVMPFLNESGNADFEYLADGMTETLISKLSKVPNLNVKARGTVFRYKHIDVTPQTVGNELGVQAILSGRVGRLGDQLSMTVELIDTATENVLWSEQYARKNSDLLMLQSEIARDAVNQLHAKLTGAEEQNVVRNYTASPAAQDLYLRGRYHWSRRTVQEVGRSLEYFQQAVDIDPNYALAYVGLSDAHLMLGIIDAMAGSSSPGTVIPPAMAAAERALVLDPNLAEAYASRGHVRWKDRDWVGAEADFKRSIEINPRYPSAHLFYALFLAFNGRTEESLAIAQRATELDPYSVPVVSGQAMIYHLARRDDEALPIARRAAELDPGLGLAYQRLGQIYLQKKMYPEAITALTKAVELGNRGQLSLGTLACAYAESGNNDEARKLLTELRVSLKDQYVSSYILATVHLALGERQTALELLERAYAERSIDMLSIKVDPKVDRLRNEPRFQEVMRKLAIP
ncbi:MAG TPA: tetratricopeptide repeat protein [Pyrinomonadaceae bacterium]|nr:tetratricopeptide repeat protein [Pyrinomonadaceae bacterium]